MGFCLKAQVRHGASHVPIDQETGPFFQPVELNTLEKWNAGALDKGLILLQGKAAVGLIY